MATPAPSGLTPEEEELRFWARYLNEGGEGLRDFIARVCPAEAAPPQPRMLLLPSGDKPKFVGKPAPAPPPEDLGTEQVAPSPPPPMPSIEAPGIDAHLQHALGDDLDAGGAGEAIDIPVAPGILLGAEDTGGGSDANFTAALGIATIDGLGPVGESPHTFDERILAHSIVERAKLVALSVLTWTRSAPIEVN